MSVDQAISHAWIVNEGMVEDLGGQSGRVIRARCDACVDRGRVIRARCDACVKSGQLKRFTTFVRIKQLGIFFVAQNASAAEMEPLMVGVCAVVAYPKI